MMADWDLDMTPVRGSSGNAFTSRTSDEERVFIKRNATPMLTSIYLEGLTPRVLWTKRTVQGDMLSAQPWINGHTLSPNEMGDRQINQILSHLHTSRKLMESCKKLGSVVIGPQNLLTAITDSSDELRANHFLSEIIEEMADNIPPLYGEEITVVHGDVNHNNWLVDDETGRVYLVDWDSTFMSDPMVDIAYVLAHYIRPNSWSRWLIDLGYEPRKKVMEKVAWYGKLSFLRQIAEELSKGRKKEANEEILGLRNFCRLFND